MPWAKLRSSSSSSAKPGLVAFCGGWPCPTIHSRTAKRRAQHEVGRARGQRVSSCAATAAAPRAAPCAVSTPAEHDARCGAERHDHEHDASVPQWRRGRVLIAPPAERAGGGRGLRRRASAPPGRGGGGRRGEHR